MIFLLGILVVCSDLEFDSEKSATMKHEIGMQNSDLPKAEVFGFLGPVYLLVHWPLIDLLVDLLKQYPFGCKIDLNRLIPRIIF